MEDCYIGTSLIMTLCNKDTSIIRTLSRVPKVTLVYKTTSEMRTPGCPNGVHNRERLHCTTTCTVYSALTFHRITNNIDSITS